MVLHRPVELAALIRHVDYFRVPRDTASELRDEADSPT
jgi:hypothetical protein